MFLLNYSVCYSQQLFVSTTGNDTNPGTQTQPFLTIAKAQQVARTLIPAMTQDVVISINDGTYFINQTLNFTGQDSGINGFNVIYRAINRGAVAINGGVLLTNWQLHDAANNIYKTQLDPNLNVRTFFVNNERAQRARTVDGTGWTSDAANKKFNCPSSVNTWNEKSELEVVINDVWRQQRVPISTVNNGIASVDDTFLNINQWALFPSGTTQYIENAYELLNDFGEWYYSKSTGVLYYKPRPNENILTINALLPRLENIVNLNQVQYLNFDGISFEGTTRFKTNIRGYFHSQGDIEFDWTSSEAAVQLVKTKNVLFKSCSFNKLGTSGISLFYGCTENAVFNCTFNDISGVAISLSQPQINSSGINLNNTAVAVVEDNNWIYNNAISNIGVEYFGHPAIMVGSGTRHLICNNDIYNVPYSGIHVGWGWNNTIKITENSLIAFNRINSVMTKMHDGGGIYTIGSMPNTVIKNNYIQDVDVSHDGHALYPDEGSANIKWATNVVGLPVKNWMYLWSNNSINNQIINNFSQSPSKVIVGATNSDVNNTIIFGEWPLAAKKIINAAGIIPNAIGDNLTNEGNIGSVFWGADPTAQTSEPRLWVTFGNQIVALDNLNGKSTLSIPVGAAGTIKFHQNDWYGSDGSAWYKLNNPVVTSDVIPSNALAQTGKMIAFGGHIFGYNGTRWCQLDELIGTPTMFNISAPMITSNPVTFDANNSNVQLNVSNGIWSGLTTTPSFSYQWFQNGVAISGAITSSYLLSSPFTANYYCIVSASNGISNISANSNTFNISSQPPLNTVTPIIENFAGELKVISSGTWQNQGDGVFTYQWQKNSVNIPNANASIYNVPAVDYNSNFSCLVSTGNNAGISTVSSNSILLKFTLEYSTQNPQVAYSTRKLATNAALALQVRRSSDNTILNIGFDAFGNLDEVALTNFVGTSNGFVSIWYDQSGNNRHATVTTANQAMLVSNGIVIKQNNRPALQGSSGSVFYNISLVPSTVNYTAMAVFRKTANNVDFYGFSNTSNQQLLRIGADNRAYTYFGSSQGVGQTISMNENLTIVNFTRQLGSGNSNVAIYRSAVPRGVITTTTDSITLNRLGAPWGSYWGGWYSEAIWYNTNLSDIDRLAIENNQLKYYDINF
ncbi:hypothetical protein [Flavobacterium ponti]